MASFLKFILVFALSIFGFSCNKKNEIEQIEDVAPSKANISQNDSIYLRNLKLYPPLFPFSNGNKIKYKDIPRDKNGIPLLNYEGKDRYYPVTYTQVPLYYYGHFMETNDETSKTEFLKMAEFIKKEAKVKGDFAVLQADFQVLPYKFTPPAASSMAQGFAIGVMIQAHALTKDESYLKMAEKFINSFGVPIEEEGIRSDWDGYPFYEEYADPNSHVLNGFLFSLAGLYYAYKTIGNEQAKKYFDEGIETLKVKIREYDAVFTSFYSKVDYDGKQYAFASAIGTDPDHYHELVISQLASVYLWSGEEIFKEYAHLFLKQDTGDFSIFSPDSKFKKITASHTIDPKEFGVNHLDDELWSWGKYWSTNKFPTELIVEFPDEKRKIEAISFFSISEQTAPRNFKVYVMGKDIKWNLVTEGFKMRMRNRNYYLTGNYETFIDTYYFPQLTSGNAVKIEFLDARGSNIVALREINIQYDRTDELNRLIGRVKRREME